MENLKVLSSHCIGTAESEKSFLSDAFVDTGKCSEIMTRSMIVPVLLVGKKGSGKSAIFHTIPTISSKVGLDSMLIKPDDIAIKNIKGDLIAIADVKRESYSALLLAISRKIGSAFDGMLTADQKTLRDEAVKGGLKDRDGIEKLAGVLSVIGKPLTNFELQSLLPALKETHHKELERKVSGHLVSTEKAFVLLIDDTDQIVPSYRANDISKIWGFLSAVRKISEEIPNIKCIVSLRTEVWRTLCQSKGQRDLVDHFRPLIFDMDVTDDEITDILKKRFELVSKKMGLDYSKPIKIFLKVKTQSFQRLLGNTVFGLIF
jgi:hypothetical protein